MCRMSELYPPSNTNLLQGIMDIKWKISFCSEMTRRIPRKFQQRKIWLANVALFPFGAQADEDKDHGHAMARERSQTK